LENKGFLGKPIRIS